MRHMVRASFLAVVLAVLAIPVQAQQGISVGPRAGTLGPGLELTTRVVPPLNVRIMGNYLPFSTSAELTDLEVTVAYEADLRLMSLGAIADWFPFRNQFKVSGGVVYNNTGAEATLVPTEAYEISGKEFAPEKIGSLTAEVDYKSSIAPYFGIGLGNPTTRRVSLALDLGVLYTNSPRVTMSGTGMISATANQAPDLEEGLSSFQWWPVVSLGVNVNLTGRQ